MFYAKKYCIKFESRIRLVWLDTVVVELSTFNICHIFLITSRVLYLGTINVKFIEEIILTLKSIFIMMALNGQNISSWCLEISNV